MASLVLCVAAGILLLGYLRESGLTGSQADASGANPSQPVFSAPVSTPLPATPTPAPTPPPAPDGQAWSDVLVVLDPGHGGRDPGTCSPDERIQEKDITLDVALRCARLLEQADIPVLLTRTEDLALAETVNADLAARSALANEADATLFVSIHVNSLELDVRGNAGVYGLECYYKGKESPYGAWDDAWLARQIGERAAAASGNRLIGVIRRSLAVLRETRMPAVLLEIGYLSNREDTVRLESETYRQDIAEGIFGGVVEALGALAPKRHEGVLQVLKRLPQEEPEPEGFPVELE
jgi:N-acetylmuramoyl-L-alanine amidase